jgi:hypothetical protein
MTLQTVIVLVLVAGAAAYLGSRYLRMFRGKAGGCGSCGCSSAKKADDAAKPIPLQELTLRKKDTAAR